MANRKSIADEIVVDRNITLRSDGCSYRVRLMVNGIRLNETFHTLQEAQAYRDRKRSDTKLDPTAALVLSSRQSVRDASITLGDLLQRYQKEITPTKKGARAERLRINKLLRFPISSMPIRMVNRDALLQFMKSPTEGWSSNNLRKYLMIISSLFGIAVKRWGMTLTNPVRQIEMPSNGQARKRRLNHEEYSYLIAELRRARCQYMAPLVQLAVETACRRGELLRLQWQDIDLEKRIAQLHDTKNGEDRVIPLSTAAVEVLAGLPVARSGNVFPIREERVRCAFDLAKKRARQLYENDCTSSDKQADPGFMRDLRFHDLRHEATSRLFEKGLDVMEASAITGHKTLSMLKNYTHLRAERLAQKLG